jgi:hypothetical protein
MQHFKTSSTSRTNYIMCMCDRDVMCMCDRDVMCLRDMDVMCMCDRDVMCMCDRDIMCMCDRDIMTILFIRCCTDMHVHHGWRCIKFISCEVEQLLCEILIFDVARKWNHIYNTASEWKFIYCVRVILSRERFNSVHENNGILSDFFYLA